MKHKKAVFHAKEPALLGGVAGSMTSIILASTLSNDLKDLIFAVVPIVVSLLIRMSVVSPATYEEVVKQLNDENEMLTALLGNQPHYHERLKPR